MSNVKYKIDGMECTFQNQIVLEKHANGRELIALIGENDKVKKFLVINRTVWDTGFAFNTLTEAQKGFIALDLDMFSSNMCVNIEEKESITFDYIDNIEITYTYSNKKELEEKTTHLMCRMYCAMRSLSNNVILGDRKFTSENFAKELKSRLSSDFEIDY